MKYARSSARRVGVLDRLALHAGVALIKWGRRPHARAQVQHVEAVEAIEWRASLIEQRRAHAERELIVHQAMQFPLRLR